MKAIRTTGAVLLMAACISGYAQGAGVAASTSATASATASTTASATVSARPDAASDASSNRRLAASVRTALRSAHRHGLKSSYIRVRAKGGVVTLTGVVADNSQIGLASSVAQGVPGVDSVVNKLKLRAVAGLKGSE